MSSEVPSKRQKLDHPTDSGDISESEEVTDKETEKALEAIDSIQNEIDGLNEKASEEILKVEQKYNKLKKVHFDKRNAIIENIPNFWVTSLLNHPQIATVVNQQEKECLQYLRKVEVEEFEDIKSGYKLTFSFKTNPFFTNEVLCKEFHLAQTGDPESKSTAIAWKDGMDLTKLPKSVTITGKGIKRRAIQQSFFSWFLDNADPAVDGLAEVIKDDMWPNPLPYYLESERGISENGYSDDDDELDESVVVVDDDDDDEDEEIYEVEDDDELDTTGDVEVIEEEEVEAEELEDDEDEEEEKDESQKEEDSISKNKDMEEDSVSKDADDSKDETEPV